MIGAVVRCAARRLTRMRIAFLTGIWPPDVGGPATHGPDFARFLVARGHAVRVVTMGDGEPAERPCEVEVVSRRLPVPAPLRPGCAAGSEGGPRGRRRLRVRDLRGGRGGGDRRPSPARRQARLRPGLRARAPLPPLRRARSRSSRARRQRRCGRSRRLGRALSGRRRRSSSRAPTSPRSPAGGGSRGARILVLTNPAPPPTQVEPEQLEPGTFVFVGRLTRQKALAVAIEAIARVPDRKARDRRRRPRAGGARAPGSRLRGR